MKIHFQWGKNPEASRYFLALILYIQDLTYEIYSMLIPLVSSEKREDYIYKWQMCNAQLIEKCKIMKIKETNTIFKKQSKAQPKLNKKEI